MPYDLRKRRDEDMTNEEFARAIEQSRELVRSGKYDQCPCSQQNCEWRGRCFECVMIHRVKQKHLPECLQPILRDTIDGLAGTVELGVVDARPTTENWAYLEEVSPPHKD
jgi:hypothetical protein